MYISVFLEKPSISVSFVSRHEAAGRRGKGRVAWLFEVMLEGVGVMVEEVWISVVVVVVVVVVVPE